ncbi:MAG: respiratory nitrate reductase subunit gamma [Armatimonadota bacterium]
MRDTVLFIGLPYVAILVCVGASLYRVYALRYSYSSLSSQFLENRQLRWGSGPWHIGILVILLAHLVVLIAPGPWSRLLADPLALMVFEGAGIALSLVCLSGLVVLAVRRLVTARLQPVTTHMDLVVLALLLAQVVLGLLIAVNLRWGAAWSAGTLAPYVRSVLMLQPDLTFVQQMPVLVKAHIVGAWLIILLAPFTRLLHLFAFPWRFWLRPAQRVIWSSPRYQAEAALSVEQESRRYFLRGAGALLVGGTVAATGMLGEIARFLLGPRLAPEEAIAQLETQQERLQASADFKALQVERQRDEYILVTRYAELRPETGKYFIDYQMSPGLAFLGEDGLPLLLSAKCTHLGCTVGNQATDGKVLCPCHVSYFDIQTGQPSAGSPAKDPLPLIGWAVKDAQGRVVVSRMPGRPVSGQLDPREREQYAVYITKRHQEGV